jgi:hypothetical protein
VTVVAIPGQPGERIDSAILRDVEALIARFKVKVTAGYAPTGHAAGGEHPLGLAVDLVPDPARGGTWADVDALARWAEPAQNHPRAPFRWVGYTGDPGHGRGNHLHLSWAHPAGNVQTITGNRASFLGDVLKALPTVGPLAGAAETAAGAAGGIPTPADLVKDAAMAGPKWAVGQLTDILSAKGPELLLYVALILGGGILALYGIARATGLDKKAAAAAGVTPAGRAARTAGAAL